MGLPNEVKYVMSHGIREKLYKLKKIVYVTLQMVVCVLIGIEVAIPPNPYKNQLIFGLVMLICLKHDIPSKIVSKLLK